MRARIGDQEREIERLKKLTVESEERKLEEKRHNLSRNVVVYGIEESDDETSSGLMRRVRDVFETLHPVMNCEMPERIGKSSGERPRPVKVKLANIEDRNALLRKARNLRDGPHKNIFLNADRTFLDRKESGRLRKKMLHFRKL